MDVEPFFDAGRHSAPIKAWMAQILCWSITPKKSASIQEVMCGFSICEITEALSQTD
jgi:hypothetical protein